jgi:cation diffusion facilitator CzcD-associated flavoprotein CzcO
MAASPERTEPREDRTDKERLKAVELAFGQIEKQFGKGAIMRLGGKEIQPIPAISTGSISLDWALGVGGLPRGRVIEIFGPESSGKTTLALQTIAQAQKLGGVAAFIDAEHALDAQYSQIDACIRFGDEVVRCEFTDGRWHLETAGGHHDVVDVVIAATGVLHHPNTPEIDGVDDFAGAVFHSARWDHSVGIDNARVGIIGTGSTAVQLVGALVDRVEHLTLFQRTAQWIMPQDNPEYTDDQKAEYRARPETLKDSHENLREMFGLFANAIIDSNSAEIAFIENACRVNLEENVHDPDLRERLRPEYRAACKRLIISPNFYDAIQRPNAELVTDRIDRVEAAGVRTSDPSTG